MGRKQKYDLEFKSRLVTIIQLGNNSMKAIAIGENTNYATLDIQLQPNKAITRVYATHITNIYVNRLKQNKLSLNEVGLKNQI